MNSRAGRAGPRDQGALSIFVAICATALLLLTGIVLDAGGRLRTIERADAVAQEAARAGGQQIDQATLLQSKGIRLDQDKARKAAIDYLRDSRMTHMTVKGTPVVKVTDTEVTVSFTSTYHTSILGLLNINTIDVTGDGFAVIVPGVQAPLPATGP